MTRFRLVLPLLAAALLFPAAAAAKGPDQASISGPGLGKTLVIKGNGEWQNSTLGQLTMLAGFFPAAYGQSPDPMLSSAPTKDLGPKYTVRYRVPGGSDGTRSWIRADFYPYAKGGALTYTKPGQAVFGMHTRGGWFVGGTQLRLTLRQAGLPARAPEGGSNAALVAGLAVPGVLVLVLAALVTRRRLRPATP